MKKTLSTFLFIIVFNFLSYAQTKELSELLNTILDSEFSRVEKNLSPYGKYSKKYSGIQKYGIKFHNAENTYRKLEIIPSKELTVANTPLSSTIKLGTILSIIPDRYYKRKYFEKIELINEKNNTLKITQETDSCIVSFFFMTNKTLVDNDEVVKRIRLSDRFEHIQNLELNLSKIEIVKFKWGMRTSQHEYFNIEPRYDYKISYADSALIFLQERFSIVDKNTPAYIDILYAIYEAHMRRKDYDSASVFMEKLLSTTNGRYLEGYVRLMEAQTLSGNIEKAIETYNNHIDKLTDADHRFQFYFYYTLNLALSNKPFNTTILKESKQFTHDCFPGFERYNPYFDLFINSKKSSLSTDFHEIVSQIKKCQFFWHSLDIREDSIFGLNVEEVMLAVSPPFRVSLHDKKKAVERENNYFESEVTVKPSIKKDGASLASYLIEKIVLPSNIKSAYASLNFDVKKDGTIININVKSDLPAEYIKEIKDIITASQPLTPAYKYNLPVDFQFVETVFFKKK